MVLVHPTACNPSAIAKIQLETGLRALQENSFCRLVLPTGKNPEMRKTKPLRNNAFDQGPYGGNAA